MENLHIATVGMTTEPILKGVQAFPVDRLILLHSVDSMPYAEDISEIVRRLPGIRCELVEIDPFSLDSVLSAILSIRRDHPISRLSINITGGTNMMAAGALVAGYIAGADAYYVSEKPIKGIGDSVEDLIVEMPVPKVTYDSLRDKQRDILKAILQSGGSMSTPGVTLAELLDTSRQNISYHLRSLESKSLLRTVEQGKTKTIELSSTGSLFARMF